VYIFCLQTSEPLNAYGHVKQFDKLYHPFARGQCKVVSSFLSDKPPNSLTMLVLQRNFDKLH
jgi:hypothetical protein